MRDNIARNGADMFPPGTVPVAWLPKGMVDKVLAEQEVRTMEQPAIGDPDLVTQDIDTAEQARRLAAEELIMIVAHELRAPLTPLQGRLELICSRAEREGRHQDLEDVHAAKLALDRLQRMIADLLDVGRLDGGIFALSPQVVDLAALARQTTDTLWTQASVIHVRTPDTLTLEADPARVQQVIENLLANALQYSPPGVPAVLEVSTETQADGQWAVLAVRDAGPGISTDLLPVLFDRFASGGSTSGLGLGLYLARSIAEAHGGTLTVDSTPGNGASFRLALPMWKDLE